jgi:hypothetical protein
VAYGRKYSIEPESIDQSLTRQDFLDSNFYLYDCGKNLLKFSGLGLFHYKRGTMLQRPIVKFK